MVCRYKHQGRDDQNGAGIIEGSHDMDNSVLLSCQAFEVEDRIRVEAVRSSEFC